jgi:hypothetical protein
MYKRIWRNSRRYTKESGEGAGNIQDHMKKKQDISKIT